MALTNPYAVIADKTITATPFSLERDGFQIWGTEYRRGNSKIKKQTPVILSHGFLSSQKETESYARNLAAWGCTAYTFDFVGGNLGGRSDGKLEDMTIETELADIRRVMDYVQSLDYVRGDKLVLLGASQGGLVSALTAAKYPDQVKSLILLYPALCIADDCRIGSNMMFKYDPTNVPDRIPAQEAVGAHTLLSGIHKKKLVLNGDYVRQMQKLDLMEEIRGYQGEVLILHGTSDPIVNVSYSKKAWKQYHEDRQPQLKVNALKYYGLIGAAIQDVPDPRCSLQLLDGAGHGFFGKDKKIAVEMIKMFMKKKAEVMKVFIHPAGKKVKMEPGISIVHMPFSGSAEGAFFQGDILPGATNVTRFSGLKALDATATFVLNGHSFTGTECQISVQNHYSLGSNKSTLRTDNKALGFLNLLDSNVVVEKKNGTYILRYFVDIPNKKTTVKPPFAPED